MKENLNSFFIQKKEVFDQHIWEVASTTPYFFANKLFSYFFFDNKQLNSLKEEKSEGMLKKIKQKFIERDWKGLVLLFFDIYIKRLRGVLIPTDLLILKHLFDSNSETNSLGNRIKVYKNYSDFRKKTIIEYGFYFLWNSILTQNFYIKLFCVISSYMLYKNYNPLEGGLILEYAGDSDHRTDVANFENIIPSIGHVFSLGFLGPNIVKDLIHFTSYKDVPNYSVEQTLDNETVIYKLDPDVIPFFWYHYFLRQFSNNNNIN